MALFFNPTSIIDGKSLHASVCREREHVLRAHIITFLVLTSINLDREGFGCDQLDVFTLGYSLSMGKPHLQLRLII